MEKHNPETRKKRNSKFGPAFFLETRPFWEILVFRVLRGIHQSFWVVVKTIKIGKLKIIDVPLFWR